MNRAASLLRTCDYLIVATGAGASRAAGLSTYAEQPEYLPKANGENIASPACQEYWRRLSHQVAGTQPNALYEWLLALGQSKEQFLVLTSNIDHFWGQLGLAADQYYELHGHCQQWQCSRNCCQKTWPFAQDTGVCLDCGAVSRPQVFMFQDEHFQEDLTKAGDFQRRLKQLLKSETGGNRRKKIVILEIGAGTTVPTLRWWCQRLLQQGLSQGQDIYFLRVNPEQPGWTNGQITTPLKFKSRFWGYQQTGEDFMTSIQKSSK